MKPAVRLISRWVSMVGLCLLCSLAQGKDALVEGGRSPDGQYEVRIYQRDDSPHDPSDYLYGVVDTRTGKVMKELAEGGGFAHYEGALEMAKVCWHSSSRFFALVDHSGRHDMTMFVYEVAPNSAVKLLKQPDYYDNALGRVDATSGYLITVVKPKGWEGDKLQCELVFDTYTRKGGRSPVYTVPFTLTLFHGEHSEPELQLTDMGKPRGGND